MSTEIASAYISLIPSLKGGQAAIASQMGAPAAAAGKEAGGKFGGGFGGAFQGILAGGALLGGMALITEVLQQSVTQADLPGSLRSQFALGEKDAAAAAKAAGSVYASGFGESLEAVGTTAGTVQQALNNLGQTGDLKALTTEAQALADKFGEEVGPTVDGAAKLVKTGLASNMDEAFDLMTVGFQNGANASGDLLDTIGEYSTKFRDLGLSGSDALGLIRQGLQGGARDADTVADALKEFSIRAIDGSKSTAEGFAAIGLNAKDMTDKIAGGGQGAKKALDQTLDGLRGIKDPAERDAAAVQLFGTKAEDLGDSLYSLDPSEAADKLGKVGGAADKLTSTKSASASITALGRSFKSGLVDAITPLIPRLTEFVEFLKPMMPILTPIALGLGVLAIATWAWNAALAANPIGLIIAAIIAAAVLIFLYWDEILAFLTMVWEGIKSVASTVWNAIVEFFTGIWDSIVGGVKAAWNYLVQVIAQHIAIARSIITSVLTGIGNFFSMIWAGIVAGVQAAWSFVVSIVTGYINMMLMIIHTIVTGIVTFLSGAWEGIKSAAQAVWNALVSAVKAAWGFIKSAVKAGIDKVMGIIAFLKQIPVRARTWFDQMRQAAISKLAALITWARSVPGKVLNALGNVAKKLWNAGKNLIRGLLDGMKNAWGAIKDWILGKLSDFKDTVLDFFGISSPSKFMIWVGEMLWSGVPIGAKKREKALAASTAEMTALAVPGADLLSGAGSEGPGELVGTAVIDLGEGIQRSFEMKWQRNTRQLRRSAMAGSGAGI